MKLRILTKRPLRTAMTLLFVAVVPFATASAEKTHYGAVRGAAPQAIQALVHRVYRPTDSDQINGVYLLDLEVRVVERGSLKPNQRVLVQMRLGESRPTPVPERGQGVRVWLADSDAVVSRRVAQPLLAATGAGLVLLRPIIRREEIKAWIHDLESVDGHVRLTAIRALLAVEDVAIALLKRAGARNVTPRLTVAHPKLRDMLLTLLEGLMPREAGAGRLYYSRQSIGLHLEPGETIDTITKMGERYGFVIRGKVSRGTPSCYVELVNKKTPLESLIRWLLSSEPRIISVSLDYYDR